MAITVLQHNAAASTVNANTYTLVYSTSATAGTLIVVGVGYDPAAGAVASVNDGTSAFTHASADTLITGAGNAELWYLLSGTAGVGSVTATFSGAAGTYAKTMRMWEVSGFTTCVLDQAAAASNQTGVGTTISGPALTTTAAGFAAAAGFCLGGVAQNPKSGNAWTAGGDLDGFGQAGCSIITGSAGTIQAQWLDNASGDSYCANAVAFKDTGATPVRPFLPLALTPMYQAFIAQ